jgi:hypothetical protein
VDSHLKTGGGKMQSLTEEKVRELYIMRREIEMEKRMREARYYMQLEEMPPCTRKRIDLLAQQLLYLDSMLSLLTEDEAFVIKRHLIDGVDWARIVKEYTEKWGMEMDKTERTFKGYQQKALRKIVQASKKRIDFTWYDMH